MNFQKFKSDSFCSGGRHRSATTKTFGDITSKGSKVPIGYCSISYRKNSMTVGDSRIKAKGLDNFLKTLGKKRLSVSKKIAEIVLSNPGRVLDLTAKIATQLFLKTLNKVYQHYQS